MRKNFQKQNSLGSIAMLIALAIPIFCLLNLIAGVLFLIKSDNYSNNLLLLFVMIMEFVIAVKPALCVH